jgi:hypothetical protein
MFQRASILYIVKTYWAFGAVLLWLAPLSVVIVAGAFLLRWINKGVPFQTPLRPEPLFAN